MFETKTGTHYVIKKEDLAMLDTWYNEEIDMIILKISAKREKVGKELFPSYYVVNLDEPYANEVLEVIKRGEEKKNA